jgi:uncharacterized protein (TIGR03437 family)
MDRSRNIYAAKCAVILSLVPLLMFAYASGPDVRRTGAPGDKTCSESGCHLSTPDARTDPSTAVNSGVGKVELSFSTGSTYTPGQSLTVIVKITDSAAKVYGFQVSSRLASDPTNGQAGTFTPRANEHVLCNVDNRGNTDNVFGTDRPNSGACPAKGPIEFIEHGPIAFTSNTMSFDWTAPTTNVGDVVFYVAGNAANGDGQADGRDHIYTAAYTLTAATSGPKPAISQGGVADAFTFNVGTASSTWTAIFGSNLSATTRAWGDADFKGTPPKLPTDLDGVGVTINGKPAYVYFISPGQINVLAPADDQTGSVQVVVTSPKGNSDPITVTKSAVQPAFYAPFAQGGKLFATVVSPAGPLLGKVGVDPRVTRPVKPGETILIYGTGFGATDPVTPPELFVVGAPPLKSQPVIRFGEVQANIQFGGMIGSGLYQFNVAVPNVPDGDVPLVAQIGSTSSSNIVYISVQK